MEPDTEFQIAIRDRFLQLPKVVQDAITSADVEQHLRTLAKEHQLHVDQWGKLEDQVQMTLLGIHEPTDLAKNIQKDIGADAATASSLADAIFKTVFEPIRQELERQLDHPAATDAKVSDIDAMRSSALAEDSASAKQFESSPQAVATPATAPTPAAAPTIVPATPPSAAPTQKVARAPISTTYTSNVSSHDRKTIEGDPYREQLT